MDNEKYERFLDDKLKETVKIKSSLKKIIGDFLRQKDFVEISPVIISPETDPLRHATGRADFEYYDGRYQLTRSMILHKQVALLSFDKIFTFSPNVRLEPIELIETGQHLIQFTQLDLEIARATREDVIELGEELITHIISKINEENKEELKFFDRELKVPDVPFERIKYHHAYNKFGRIFEEVLSQEKNDPFWIVDIPSEDREFYDKEDSSRPGILRDMDMIYPEGYGEALSGGEREHEPDRIRKRLEEHGLNLEDFKEYLDIAERGLPPSAGFGLGIERLTRYICGLDDVKDTVLFPKQPGKVNL
ncbi:MAG: asparagine synthetase A [Thermoplasmatota archaeon]